MNIIKEPYVSANKPHTKKEPCVFAKEPYKIKRPGNIVWGGYD